MPSRRRECQTRGQDARRRTAFRLGAALALTGLLATAVDAGARTSPPRPEYEALPEIVELVDAGRFEEAERLTDQAEAAEPSATSRREIAFQRERMRRILLDFRLDGDQLRAAVLREIPDLRDDEFDRWRRAGLFDAMRIDGQLRYFARAPHNLFRLSAEARARRARPRPFYDSPLQLAQHAHHAEVRAGAGASTAAAPRRVRITQSLVVKPDAVPAGETIRAWLPYARDIPGQQEGIQLLRSEPARARLAPPDTLQRTAYLERQARAGEPTRFSVSYELTVFGQHVAVDPERVVPVVSTPELAPHLEERAPHIVFTDAMRLFSAQVVGDETNPYRIARRLFDAVDRIPWAGAREYSTITNLGAHALESGRADCGQQTLLLITLLRLNGIPARWQSGWIFSDGSYNNMHDWGWLYLAPYGWMPMDVTFGRLPGTDPGLEHFYLGGMDAYRVAFNDDYGRDFVPAKTHFRSETIDLQRGEAEWDGGNLYFDQWDYDFEWELLPLPQDQRS
ncbi:transglutaminase-like domain-containing protein [Luteimonas sp. SDU101]|uniref:transglutaminase-like domain-containing protein n=1 Tax=unclassified Luteimonas TaxID=2629088 RepID=UPI003EBC6C4B